MLIRFKVKNYLSFDKEEEIPMACVKSIRSKQQHVYKSKKLKLLKFIAVWGANASGKSNLVTAMSFARDVITRGIPTNCENQYFRINDERKKETSKFEFEIKLDKKYYAYGFELVLNKKTIAEEWLYELKPDNSENLIFKRDISSKKIEFSKEFDGDILKTLKTYSDSMGSANNILFITEMNRYKEGLYEKHKYKKLAPFRDVYHWFRDRFIINYPDSELSPAYFIKKEKFDEINNLLPKLGLGLTQCKIVPGNSDELQQQIPHLNLKLDELEKQTELGREEGDDTCDGWFIRRGPKAFFILKLDPETHDILIRKLQIEHEQVDTWFDISEESDGTRRFFDLIELLISANAGIKKVYVIDEIDRCLHPLLTHKLIETYLDLVDQKEIQLIITTHESHLLDLNLLRRDEIWFVDKGKDGASHFITLAQYSTRFDKKILRAYLDGRYEGVPRFDEYYP